MNKNILSKVSETIGVASQIQTPDTTNNCGFAAYSLSDELRLISMLNTLKIESQAYRSDTEMMIELSDLINRIGSKDPYFLAQCIVYSRCVGEGMRSINHLAAAIAAPYVSGQEWTKRFYGLWDKKANRGGCIYRVDDMSNIKDIYKEIYGSPLSNGMKKGFASVIANLDEYQMAKYKKSVIDISNLVHPKGVTKSDILAKILKGETVKAETWEKKNSDAGKDVAEMVAAGNITAEQAEKMLAEKKQENWKELLSTNRLGILAALRNIRNIIEVADSDTVYMLCNLLSNCNAIKNGKVMPYQIDTAYEVVRECCSSNQFYHNVSQALLDGYEKSIPNLAEVLPGKTCVMIDCSGSMHTKCYNGQRIMRNATAVEKAGLIAATIAKSCNADVIRFGSHAEMAFYDKNMNVFDLSNKLSECNMGGTNISSAFDLAIANGVKYDRIIILSDYECNCGRWTSMSYKDYVAKIANPYVYCVDFASYGTTQLKGNRVGYYFGYGYAMFDDISSREFDPERALKKVRKIVI